VALKTEIEDGDAAINVASPSPILSARGMTKSFPGVRALQAVDFDVRPGEVHALCGENGAGKSTLMRILAGDYQPDEGEITFRGRKATYRNAREARAEGILLIHQEISLVPDMTVAENLFLGSLPRTGGGIVRRGQLVQRARAVLESAGSEFGRIDPKAKVVNLSFAHQQMVEIARALAFKSSVVIFDEPTASLTLTEANALFATIARLKAQGVAIVYISHKMSEVFALSDRITVLRDGSMRGTLETARTDEREITRLMIGRDIAVTARVTRRERGAELLKVEGLAAQAYVKDVSFSVYEGEVLGLYGLIGAGRTETMEAVFGVRKRDAGRIYWRGREVSIRSARDAVRLGIGLVPEDRKGKGLVLGMSGINNLTMVIMRLAGMFSLPDRRRERATYEDFRTRLDIRAASPDVPVNTLSGGNQQKVALAKWLATDPKLLVLDEPTRGIDVGAKAEIHALIARLAASGVSIVLISSELPEILALSTRVLAFSEGRIVGAVDGADATEERLLTAVVGRTPSGDRPG
jgi:ABC-type sugar transport system ATPase subunit